MDGDRLSVAANSVAIRGTDTDVTLVPAPRALLRTNGPRPMTQHAPFDGAIETDDGFEAALGDLIAAASGNGIDLEGSWE